MSPKELASRFQCNRATVFRLLDDLQNELGIPLDRTREGVYLHPEHYRFTVRLNRDGVMALLLAVRAYAYQQDKRTRATASALTALAEATRSIAPALSAHIRRTAAQFDDQDEHEAAYERVLQMLTETWVEGYRIHLYYASDPTLARPFDVYFIEPSPLSARLTYVFGHDHSRQALRTFAIERIRRVVRMLERYEIPADFDPYALLARAWGMNWGDGAAQPTEVVLRFRPGRAAQRVQESRWHPTQRITPAEDGGCEFRVLVGEPMEMLPRIRQWGPDCEVLAPKAVRQRVQGL
ncbi:MAG: WYL domain-containing protein, partial [Anaerolineae bacterium]|nr:WYL domain-containing protein [Anaerolineae bacterium]